MAKQFLSPLVSWILVCEWLTSFCYLSVKVTSGSQQICIGVKEKATLVRKLKVFYNYTETIVFYVLENMVYYYIFLEKGEAF